MVLRRSTTDWTCDRHFSSVARSMVAFMIGHCPLGTHTTGIGGAPSFRTTFLSAKPRRGKAGNGESGRNWG
jgi:hypothetical protein